MWSQTIEAGSLFGESEYHPPGITEAELPIVIDIQTTLARLNANSFVVRRA
jgi:hypothetical protein